MAEPFRLAIVQPEVSSPIEQDNVDKLVTMIDHAYRAGAKLVVLPELCTSDFFCWRREPDDRKRAQPVPGERTQIFCQIAGDYGIHLVLPVYELVEETGCRYNTAILISDDGEIVGRYRKTHVPCIRGDSVEVDETYYFSVGNLGFPVFDVGEARIGIAICWDRHYPETFRTLAQNGADIAVVVSATPVGLVPEGGTRPLAHWQLENWLPTLQSAALSNSIYVAAANRVGREPSGLDYFGRSALIGPWGQTIHLAPDHKEYVLIQDVDIEQVTDARERLPFDKYRRPETYTR